MKVLVTGMSHRSAPVELRERLAFNADEVPRALGKLIDMEVVDEVAIVSTCNRVEVYATSEKPEHASRKIREFFAMERPVSIEEVESHSYSHSGMNAVRHLYRVSAGLDSMVLGEPQILGQVKDAYRSAAGNGYTGVVLNKLFHRAFQSAKRVRTETRVGNYAVSVASTAVELAAKIFGDLTKCSVMLVGAGNMGELAAQHLVGAGVPRIIVSNRTYTTAERLAARFKGEARPFAELGEALADSDIVIATTGSPQQVISYRMVHDAIKTRRHKPIFLIDIAVPRDVEPKVRKLDEAYLYDIDDLKQITESHMHEREREASVAESIVSEEVAKFEAWLSTLEVVPTIVSLRSRFEEVAKDELNKALEAMPDADERQRKAVEVMAHNIVHKLLHEPMTMLKKCAESGKDDVSHACRVLFKLQVDAGDGDDTDDYIEELDD